MLEKNLQKKNTDNSTDKLKSCLFCGCELASQPDIFSGGMVYTHENNCIKKLSESPDFRELWNTRPLEDTLRAENAKLAEEKETWKTMAKQWDDNLGKVTAENARLREMLGEVVEYDRAIRGDLSEKGWRVKMNSWNDVVNRIQSELKE